VIDCGFRFFNLCYSARRSSHKMTVEFAGRQSAFQWSLLHYVVGFIALANCPLCAPIVFVTTEGSDQLHSAQLYKSNLGVAS